MKRRIVEVLVLVGAVSLIAACGGGGGGGGGGGSTSDDVCGGATMGCVTGVVQDATGAVITSGISVTSEAATAAAQTLGKAATDFATTNGQGWFSGDNLEEGEQVLCFSGTGYVKKCISLNVRAKENTPIPPVKLPTRNAAITVNNIESGASQAQDPNTTALLDFNQANSVCDSAGNVVTGSVDCYLTPFDASATDMTDVVPESFIALTAAGAQGTMVSSAIMEATCEQGGNEVNICANKTVGVRVPVYDAACATDADRNPPNIDAWFFSETAGNWQDYGNDFARTCGGAPDQTNSYYAGAVDHFTWINGDKWRDDACLTGLVYTDGTTLTGTNLTVQCWGSGWRNSAQVGADGRFCIPVPNGYTYTCKVGDSTGWIDQSEWITGTATGPIVVFGPNFSCPDGDCIDLGDAFTFASPILTTTFTWGADPRDLDSHTFGNGVHVWYSDKDKDWTKGSLNSAPFISLDVDDTSSYGPEVTTVMPAVADGKYCFGIHLFAGDGAMNQTSTDEFGNPKVATVTVTGDGVARTFEAPSGTSTDYWRVYSVEFEGGRVKSGSFTSINDYTDSEPSDCDTW